MARTFYDVLMVSPRADRELISVVYRHLAKRYHPDMDASPEAAARMTELNEAYGVLGDQSRRTRYDQHLGLLTAPGRVAAPGDGRPTRSGGVTLDPSPAATHGEAGPPPANPAAEGRPLSFGRYRGWTLNQVARHDFDYIEWLSRTTMGRNYRRELDELLHRRP